jgi:hypothetical protein
MQIRHGSLVADAHRSVTTVPAQARLDPLLPSGRSATTL